MPTDHRTKTSQRIIPHSFLTQLRRRALRAYPVRKLRGMVSGAVRVPKSETRIAEYLRGSVPA